MSKIIVFEIPDDEYIGQRKIFNHIKEICPNVELRISADFEWWRKACEDIEVQHILPLIPPKTFMKNNIDKLIELFRNPKSIEERRKS